MSDAVPTRVYIVDDSAAIRTRLSELLSRIAGATVVGEADSEQVAIAGILEANPDVVVLDLHLPGGSGIEVLRSVHGKDASIGFIVLTNHPNAQYRRICMEAGASHFLDKNHEFMKVNELVSGWSRRVGDVISR